MNESGCTLSSATDRELPLGVRDGWCEADSATAPHSSNSVSTQMGKPYSIPREDYIIRSASSWYTQAGSIPSDVGLSAMVEMHRIIGRMIDVLYSDTRSVSGLNAHLDYPLLMRAFLQQLDQWRSDWTENEDLVRESDGQSLSNLHQMRGKPGNRPRGGVILSYVLSRANDIVLS